MALKVWLPLNGSLENKGISNVTVTNNGATVNNNGKIGKCYSFDGNSYIDTKYTESFGTGDFSICAWIYLTQVNGKTYQCIIGNKNTPAASVGCAIYWNQSQKKFLWSTADGSNATEIWSVDTFDSIIYNSWHHIIMVRDNNDPKKGYFYLDGERKEIASIPAIRNVSSTTSIKIGSVTPISASYCYTGRLNDVRLYDHALSAKEAKEISQGLVLHYKLDNPYIEATTNLITAEDCLSATCYNGATGKYSYGSNTDMYKEVTTFDGHKGTKVYMGTDGNAAFPYVYINNMFTSDGTNAPMYKTLSFDYYTNIGTSIRPYKLGSGSGTASYILYNSNGKSIGTGTDAVSIPIKKNEWNHIEITFHGTTAANAEWGYIQNYPSHTSDTANFWFFSNMQLETKDHATGYAGVGGNRGKGYIIDSSGYENNGRIEGDLIILENSSRYNYSTYFNGNSYIDTGAGTFNWFDFSKCTIANWIYPTASMSSYSGSVGLQHNSIDGYYSKCISNTNSSNKFFTNLANGSGWLFINSGKDLPINEWHHLVSTLDGTTLKQYLDGQLVKTTIIDWNTAYVASDTRFAIGVDFPGSDEKFTGNYSDIRFYATTLSAEDILDLYHTSANIDNLGGVHGFELKENNNNIALSANSVIAEKDWNASTLLKSYTQSNCQVTLTDDGLRIYRPPNVNPTDNGNTMWGGMRLTNTSDGGKHIYNSNDNKLNLMKGHTYIITLNVKGKSSNASGNVGWSNNMGWGGGGLQPSPSSVEYDLIPNDFNGEKICWYKWTINDDIVKTCTTSYSYAVAGNKYLSYADFAFGWHYQNTGSMGTDIYITDIQLYDITNIPQQQILQNGVLNFQAFQENGTNIAKIYKNNVFLSNTFIEK